MHELITFNDAPQTWFCVVMAEEHEKSNNYKNKQDQWLRLGLLRAITNDKLKKYDQICLKMRSLSSTAA